jgi:APA family basic amino acid/polyamine antiporter
MEKAAANSVTKIRLKTATLLVVANMIGTGLFTSLGYQLLQPFKGLEIALLWFIGGVLVIFGSLCYGTLASYIPRSGGEVQFLTKIYGRPYGLSAGIISILAGFAAPIAAAAYALASYSVKALGPAAQSSEALSFIDQEWFPKALAIAVILGITLLHFRSTSTIEGFQNFFVLLKILVILALIGLGFHHYFFVEGGAHAPLTELIPNATSANLLFGPGFALCLIYVAYAYSGWNAAVYIADEIEDAEKNLPKALLFGTIIVVTISVLLNAALYFAVPRDLMEGKKEVAFFAAQLWLGSKGGYILSACIAIGLVSAVSSMIWAGSRVIAMMAKEFDWAFGALGTNANEVRPSRALWLICGLASLLIATSGFQFILELVGFSLTLCSTLAVAGIFILNRRHTDVKPRFRDPFHPYSAYIYVSFCAFILGFGAIASPTSFLTSLAIFFVGLGVGYVAEARIARAREATENSFVPSPAAVLHASSSLPANSAALSSRRSRINRSRQEQSPRIPNTHPTRMARQNMHE